MGHAAVFWIVAATWHVLDSYVNVIFYVYSHDTLDWSWMVIINLVKHNFSLLLQDQLQLLLTICHMWLENYYELLPHGSWISTLNISMEYSHMSIHSSCCSIPCSNKIIECPTQRSQQQKAAFELIPVYHYLIHYSYVASRYTVLLRCSQSSQGKMKHVFGNLLNCNLSG